MEKKARNQKILIISNHVYLADNIRRIMDGKLDLDYAPDAAAGLKIIRETHPDVIILGNLDPPEVVVKFYQELQTGWISRHSSLIIAGFDIANGEILRGLLPQEPHFVSNEHELKDLIEVKLGERENTLRSSILDPDSFCLTWEQIPGLGAFEIRQETVLENARQAARGGQICAISIVDNPGGNPAIATDILCSEIRKAGIEPMVHLAFRDKNRNQVESLLYQLAALDINNLLVLTGDYPSSSGFLGKPKPVFDLDSVNGLRLIARMNLGMEVEILRRQTRLAPTEFFAGVAISPFKQEEAEVMGQYYKLKKKIEAGADFAITQIGYDARKLEELQLWLKTQGYQLPVLTSIQVLSYTAAKAMHDNRVPGCVVTDKLLAQIAEESRSHDKGKMARLERAAKMYAISRGLNFKGACISGQGLVYENVEYIVNRGQELTPNWRDWLPEFDYPQDKGFYYFEKNISNNLNLETPAPRLQRPTHPPIYYLSRLIHSTLFETRSPLFQPVRALMRFIDSKRILNSTFHSLEYWTKAALYGCKDCGDCALFDVAYLCPVSQCPKDQRNGPCGGSYQGWCEVYPNEKQCIWVRAYRRLKAQHKEDTIGDYIVPPCNWELWQTSSWSNYFLGRDHVSRRTGIKPPVKEENLPRQSSE